MQTMATPVLVTKLYIPPPRSGVVARPRLIERLNGRPPRKLTLISAPAGFGKTTLVSEWLAGSEYLTAWLSLDDADNEPTRFLTYLIAALQTVAPNVGDGVLQSSQPPPTEQMLTALLNDIATLPDDIVLVLDDYHLVDAQPVDDVLTYLLDHLPPRMHLVMTTREDPRLPLARLRVRGEMTEIRAADLRFTHEEAAAFLNQAMGLDLSAADLATLETRTEGWIAGLQLAAISMQGNQDAPGFIRACAGNHRYIVDYLVEEVLRRQSEPARDFLLQTSILDRLSGPLCDAVTNREHGSARLESLERGNFFVVPLDDKRLWYRYHHLFADVLQAQLVAEQPALVPTLHQRAGAWYEQNGLFADAIRHALAATDFAHAADLIERAMPDLRRSRREAAALGWIKTLPHELVHCRPVLCTLYAGLLLNHGEVAGVQDLLENAERWLEATAETSQWPGPTSAGMVVADEEEFHRLPGSIAVYRAGRALVTGDLASTVHHARRALDLIPDDDHFYRGAAAALLGLAAWTGGDLEAAHRSYAEGMASLQRAGYIADAIGGVLALADIRIAQGRLHDAMRTYQQALRLAAEHSTPRLRGTADMYVGMSELSRERNDLDAAIRHLQTSTGLGDVTGFPQNPYRWRVAMARIREAQGDLDGALDLLDEAERLYASDFFPNVRPIAALRTRVWLAQGRLDEALAWAREKGLSANDDLSYVREFEHITLARVILAQTRDSPDRLPNHGALALLERLLPASEAGERTASVIEILVVQALAHTLRGDIAAALVPLERALTLAETEDYVRMFIGEGPPMARLLAAAVDRGIMPDYAGRLLAAYGGVEPASAQAPATPRATTAQTLVEPLSPRELEVLGLIAEGLSNHEIGERLYLALSTVKGHNRVIFGKLDVQRRTEAVARARNLGLV